MNEFENELKKRPLRRVPEHWRAQILAQASAEERMHRHEPWWTALLWPSPKAWGTLAAAWAVMIMFSIATRERTVSEEAPQATQIRMAVEEKRRLQAEIEEASMRVQVDSPKPRSEMTLRNKPV